MLPRNLPTAIRLAVRDHYQRTGRGITTPEVAEQFGLTWRQAGAILTELERRGNIRCDAPEKTDG